MIIRESRRKIIFIEKKSTNYANSHIKINKKQEDIGCYGNFLIWNVVFIFMDNNDDMIIKKGWDTCGGYKGNILWIK